MSSRKANEEKEALSNSIKNKIEQIYIKPVKNIKEAEETANEISNELHDSFNNEDLYDPDNYNYIVLVEAASVNDYSFFSSGKNRLLEEDNFFSCFRDIYQDTVKQSGHFYFSINVWQIKKN